MFSQAPQRYVYVVLQLIAFAFAVSVIFAFMSAFRRIENISSTD